MLHSKLTGGPLTWNLASSWQEAVAPTSIHDIYITGDEVQTTTLTDRCHSLTVNSGAKLTCNSGSALTIGAGGVFTIESGGSFKDLANQSLTATVKRNVAGNWTGGLPNASTEWHYVSSPVSGATINTFLGCLMNSWDEPGYTWAALTIPTTTPMLVGTGYAVASPALFNASFTGTLNSGNKAFAGLTNSTPSNPDYGYNLVGNPYPSAIKWDLPASARTNIEGAAYLWSGTTYVTHMWDDAPAYEIQAEQGFFVHATSGGSMQLTNANQVHSSGSFVKSSGAEQITLTINGNDLQDKTSVRFNEMATESFDGEYDAYKLFGIEACPQIYSLTPQTKLSINSLPDLNVHPVIPIGLKVGVATSYTITASDFETLPSGTEFYLEDLVANKVQNLKVNPVYNFTAESGQVDPRFYLHFAPVGIPDDNSAKGIKVYAAEKTVYVNVTSELKGSIVVYNMLGSEITRTAIQSLSLNKINLDVPSGFYLVKVSGDLNTTTTKVFIR